MVDAPLMRGFELLRTKTQAIVVPDEMQIGGLDMTMGC
jgi:hypothetical protein